MRTSIIFIMIVITVIFIACDPDLFKTEDEVAAPEVSDIMTDLSNSRLNAGETAGFWVHASNPDGGNLSYNWNSSCGSFLTVPDVDTVQWRAPYSGGTCTISISVSNQEKTTSRSRIIEVVSLDTPSVSITSPAPNSYLVQYNPVELQAEAFHDNGIAYVEFFINDHSIGIVDGHENIHYQINWDGNAPAGSLEVKVNARANITSIMGSDSIIVMVEGIIIGKE